MKAHYDLLVRGGRIATPEGLVSADIGVAGGRIERIDGWLVEPARETVDAAGKVVFPGIIDSHVHFNEPGRTEWEGSVTGSAALAAGGGAVFFDMPLNSLPPTIDAESFAAKRAAIERSSRLDFALWGGLVPGNLEKLPGLAEAGAVGFKAFMCDSGAAEFSPVDATTLKRGMERAALLGLPVAVHAEDDSLVLRRTEEARAKGRDIRAWLSSRPVEVELAAIRTALELAGETGCALHIVHVSSPEGADLACEARKRGVDVTVETCPHYLLLTDEDVMRLGAQAKCCPCLRSEEQRLGLWRRLEEGLIDTVGSDHSPAPPELKQSDDFFAVWGGISGCQHGFPLVVSEALARGPEERAWSRLASAMAAKVAERFRLDDRKGRIAEGMDADFSIIDAGSEQVLSNGELLYRHRQGPYDGKKSSVKIVQTFVRGRSIFSDGRIAPDPGICHFLRPRSAASPRSAAIESRVPARTKAAAPQALDKPNHA